MFNQILAKGSYQTKVQHDVVTFGPAVEALGDKVKDFGAATMEEVLEFVSAGEAVLSQLYDECAVLRRVAWPEAKWDALKEAAFLHR
jgi:hypothetical protein